MNNKKSQMKLVTLMIAMVLLSAIVLAALAFPRGETELRAKMCNTESASATSNNFIAGCVANSSMDFNDATTQTANTTGNNQYMGIRISSFNISTINCGAITNVKLCYEWWSSSASIGTCSVKVDADAGVSYSTASTTCPGTGANPGTICTDVTSLESWTCSNFLTASGTRAFAYLEVRATNAGSKTLTVDTLFFNVTYTSDNAAPAIAIDYPSNTTYTYYPDSLNTTITDANLQACWWSNNSGRTNSTFTCNTNLTGVNATLGTNIWKIWANDSFGNLNSSTVTFNVNLIPTLSNISITPNPAGTGSSLTVLANGVNDSNQDSLNFYCSETSSSPTDNSLCSGGGNLTNINSLYYPACLYYHNRAAGNYTVYCRLHDGYSYSRTVNLSYQVVGDSLSTSVISVAYDSTPSYYDTANDGKTDILVSGSSGMSCKWSSSDLSYSAMSSSCSVSSTTANCSVNDVASQGFTSRYVSCQDAYGNSQSSSNNLNIDFYLDYTAPTTSDNSVTSVQLPGYAVTITETDNVDSDPTSYYCSSTSQGCSPISSIDNLGQIAYTSSNRGANYLRYYSIDDAGNSQVIVNKTININQLPIFTSASDNAVTIQGGASVTISTDSRDPDSGQTLILYVCGSSGATSSGCTGTQYCSATASANLSCGFASETDTASHTWYAYIYDALGEPSSTNPLTGSYTTDSSGPGITVINPSNTTHTQASVTAEIITSENAFLAWYHLDNNFTANRTMSNVSATQWVATISGLLVGSHSIVFYANDSFGNLQNSSLSYFTIASPADTAPPAITIINPGNATHTSTSVFVNITTDEALSWAGYELNSGSLVSLTSATITNWYANLNTSQESTNTLIIFANDSSNNQGNRTITFYSDTLAPRYTSAMASPSIANVSQNVNCSATWTDVFNITSVKIGENSLGSYENHTISFSGITGSSSYLISGGKLTVPGTYYCYFYATDAAGNSDYISTSFSIRDVISPTLNIISPSNLTYNTNSVVLSLITSETASSAWYSLDGAGNVTLGNTSSVAWNSSVTGVIEGSHNVIFYANDSSNNVGVSSTIYFVISLAAADTIPPVITIDTIANASYKTSTTVDLNISTNENTNWAMYKLNSGSLVSMSNSSNRNWNATLSSLVSESTNSLIVFANDTSKNKGNISITFYFDSVAPRFLTVNVTPSIANETQSVVCSAYFNDTFSLSKAIISENATIPGTFLNHSIDLFAVGWGNYTIINLQKGGYGCIFYATDAAGNSNSSSISFSVNDITAPVITINSPLNQTYSTNSILFSISTDENLTQANYSLDSGVTNISLSGSGKSWSTTASLTAGRKYLKFYAADGSGNVGTASTEFLIDTSVNDATAPTITIWSPANNSYYSNNTILLNITADEALSWAGYSNNSNTLYDLGNVSTTNWNKTTVFPEGIQTITFYANDSSANKNQGVKTIGIYVDLTNPSVDSFSCTDVNDSKDVTCSYGVSDAIGLSYLILSWNATGSWQNSSVISLSGLSSTSSYNISAGNTTPPGFTAAVYLYDSSGRSNLTSSDFVAISDDTLPKIYNISYVPNATTELDPGVIINITVSIVEDYSPADVYLMYKNSSASVWTSMNMSNRTRISAGVPIIYNASFTASNGTWFFKISASDSDGNVNISENYTIYVENETTFFNSTSINEIKSFTLSQEAGNNSLGNLYLNNTGDNYLNFTLDISGAIYSRFSINYTLEQTKSYFVSPGNSVNLSIEVNTTDLPVGLYSYNLSISSDAGQTNYSNQLNIQTAEGPYLVVSIDTYSSSVIGGQNNVEFSASVKNLGTHDASDVYLTWTIPSEFLLNSGNLSRSLGNMPIGVTGQNSILINVSSSSSDRFANVSAVATSSNADSKNASKQVSIGSPPTVPVVGGVSGGGSGVSGGGGGGGSATVYSKTIELVRGKEDSFEIEFENKFWNKTIKDLTLEIMDFPFTYITNPERFSSVKYGEKVKFKISTRVPAYENYKEFDIVARFNAQLVSDASSQAYGESQNIKLIVQEMSEKDTSDLLNKAREAIEQMKTSKFNTNQVETLFKQASVSLLDKKNKQAYDLAESIVAIKDKAFAVDKLIRSTIGILKNPGDSSSIETGDLKGITGNAIFGSSDITNLIDLAIAAFERGDYETAKTRIESANQLLLLERKGNIGLFFYLYWYFVIIGLAVFLALGVLGYRSYQKSSITRKIEDLDRKEDNIRKLLIGKQEAYFSGKLGQHEYHQAMGLYSSEIAKIKKSRINLRNKRVRLLSQRKFIRDLDIEKMQVEAEIKVLQKKFYVDKNISESGYKLEFEILNGRLAEIEEERTTLQLMNEKKEIKGKYLVIGRKNE